MDLQAQADLIICYRHAQDRRPYFHVARTGWCLAFD
jgi:hypothetical protein